MQNCTHPLHDGIRRHHNALSKCRVAQAPKRTRCYQPHSHTLSLLQCHTYTIDVSRREVVYKTADEVRSEVGDVDILINNAGILNDGKFMDVSDERIRKVMEVNVMANIWVIVWLEWPWTGFSGKSIAILTMRSYLFSTFQPNAWKTNSTLSNFCSVKNVMRQRGAGDAGTVRR